MLTIADKPKNVMGVENFVWGTLIEIESGLLTNHLIGVLFSQIKMNYKLIESDELRQIYDSMYERYNRNRQDSFKS